ncbi:putative ankyrin repeat protein [Zancudomyces culisetae]|uniref:Putative ankyrin repeat protein n=1 Tax=Zancudomyces culisetae TaxID=1213189 RepID=A0A1R1PGC6_ZANCU|nr:putative ankyrin repeat protein [Zancudomyces culisetae]|eukprot:OMH79997.1 putative ankyrin repeat protein [Zancudomyces culisetae]
MNSRRKKAFEYVDSYYEKYTYFGWCYGTKDFCYKKISEIIRYIVENDLQNTFEYTEHDETNELGYEKDVEVLNDWHYELVKSGLVNLNFEVLKLLIEYGMDVNSADGLILRTAYKAGDIDWIDYFISKGAKFGKESDGFIEACESDKVEVLEHWIRNGGVVPNNPGYPCISMACLLGNFDMVKLLVENGVDLSDPNRNGVRIACRLGFKRTLKYLLDNNAAIEGVRHHQLEYACLTEDIELVKMILDYYDSLGVLEKKNQSCTKEGEKAQNDSFLRHDSFDHVEKYKITKALLEKGEPIQNCDLLDGIEIAIRLNNTELLKILLTCKISFTNHTDILNPFIKNHDIEVVKLLLENGLSVHGNTDVLQTALKEKNAEIIRLLLLHGAKIYWYSKYLKYVNLDDIETLQLMLTCCPGICGDSYLLQSSIDKNKIDVVKLLLKDTTTFYNCELDFIYIACRSNNVEMLKLGFWNQGSMSS